jgi:hypothetical protein
VAGKYAIIPPPRKEEIRVEGKREPSWELSIGPDTVRLFIEKANAISAGVNEDYVDGGEHEVELDGDTRDNHHHDGLAEEKTENLLTQELRALINDLNVDEASELIALMWIGRGDYDGSEWAEALNEARQRGNRHTFKYLLGMQMLGDWLEQGLEAIGA